MLLLLWLSSLVAGNGKRKAAPSNSRNAMRKRRARTNFVQRKLANSAAKMARARAKERREGRVRYVHKPCFQKKECQAKKKSWSEKEILLSLNRVTLLDAAVTYESKQRKPASTEEQLLNAYAKLRQQAKEELDKKAAWIIFVVVVLVSELCWKEDDAGGR